MKFFTRKAVAGSAKLIAAVVLALLMFQVSFAQIVKQDPSQSPPNGLLPAQVPQLVTIGFDDNGVGDGIEWILDYLKNVKNPAGAGQAATFDGTPARVSFYCTANYLDEATAGWNPDGLKHMWKRIQSEGHEVGNHTWSHSELLKTMDEAGWSNELDSCNRWLTRALPPVSTTTWDVTPGTGAGLSASTILGFRTPFLAYGGPVFPLLKQKGFLYDCSIEEGNQADQDGTNFFWPYTFDNSALSGHYKSWKANPANPEAFNISDVPGLWELPQTLALIPDDATCLANGWPTGMRARIKTLPDLSWFVDKMTSFDWNLWDQLDLSKAEFLAVLKHTFNLHYYGNRAPFTIGGHTDIYSSQADPTAFSGASLSDRRAAIEEFITWVLAKPDVRVVPSQDIIKYCQYPVALQAGNGPFKLNITSLNGIVQANPQKAEYTKGESVILTAVPNSGYTFDKWSGGASGTSATINLVMDANKDVVANFKKVITCSDFSELITDGNIVSAKDILGSTIDAVTITGGQFTVNYQMAAQSGNIWPWVEIECANYKPTYAGLCSVKITYKTDKKVRITLNNPTLAGGTSHMYELPVSASTWKTVTLQTSSFAQPSWVSPTSALDVSKVNLLMLVPIEYGVPGKIEVKELKVYGIEPKPVGVGIQAVASSETAIEINGIYNNTIHVQAQTEGTFAMSVYSFDGKLISNKSVEIINGENAISMDSELSTGAYFVRLVNENTTATKKFVVVK